MTLAALAEPLTYWLIAVNFAAFAAFGLDKARAEAGAWRISEGTLIGLAWLGGTLGAYAGRRAFRHKTRKVSFTRRLGEVVGTQGVLVTLAVLGAAGWSGEGAAPHPAEPLPPDVAALVDADAGEPAAGQAYDGPIDHTPSALGLTDDAADEPVAGRRRDGRAPYTGLRLVGCDAVRAAGRAPLTRADPDYHPAMDRDGDGIACEPVKNSADGQKG